MGVATQFLLATVLGPLYPIFKIVCFLVTFPMKVLKCVLTTLLFPILLPFYVLCFVVKTVAWIFLWPIFLPWRIISYL
ncbi:hypothetical protein V8C86DRAFT_2667261, partial [Haematococcus lacustris]